MEFILNFIFEFFPLCCSVKHDCSPSLNFRRGTLEKTYMDTKVEFNWFNVLSSPVAGNLHRETNKLINLFFFWGGGGVLSHLTKRYQITSQGRVKCVCRIHHRLVQVRQNLNKEDFSGWRAANAFPYPSSFIVFFVLLHFFLKKKINLINVKV